MNFLFLSSRPPYPPSRADQMTVDRMVRFLFGRGHSIDLACFVQSKEEERKLIDGLGPFCRRIDCVVLPWRASYGNTALGLFGTQPMQVSYYRSQAMERIVQERVESGDHHVVYVHLIRMAEYARRLALPKVLGMQISQGLNLSRLVDRASDPARRFFYRLEERRVRPYEAQVCADFDRVVLCGRRDVEEIEKTSPIPNAVVCPHGQDVPPLESVRTQVRQPGAIVFSGVMATYTNVDAVTWFAREIFPRIKRDVAEATFWIVGRNPQRSVRALANPPTIVVTGEVPDVYDWLCRAAVAVDPLRIGAGMQNKVVQAMACELPVVATSEANEGIGAKPNDEIELQDSPEDFAAALVRLLRDAKERERLGRAGRRFVEANWTWDAHFEKFEKILRSVARA